MTTAEVTREPLVFINAGGAAAAELPAFAAEREHVVALYRGMLLARTFDTRAVGLQRTGRLGTYASGLGQEAAAVGVADAMRAEDVLCPGFREHGAQLQRGVRAVELLRYWGGDERGSDFRDQRLDFPVCIPVGSQAPHAAGAALAFQVRGERRVAVAVFGDGATSKGDIYEAMNVAGAWRLPVVFVCINNQWAISVPRRQQSAAIRLSDKALGAGFEGLQVDGNDVIAVRHVVATAVEAARDGAGPTLVEALTYRLADHTTVDDASRYRDDEEVARYWKQEPLARMRGFLTARFDWDKQDEESLIAACESQIDAAVDDYLATPAAEPESMFDFLYRQLPEGLDWQRRAVAEQS